jgi:tolkin protein
MIFLFLLKEYNSEFEKRIDAIDTMGMPYDYYSIMHYKYNTFATDTSLPTILPKNINVNIYDLGSRDDLSRVDILKIKKYYNCSI